MPDWSSFGFLLLGEVLLTGIGVRLVSFQLAGGVILFLFGLQMVFGSESLKNAEPAIMAVVLLTDNHRHSIAQQALTAAVLIVVLAITLMTLLLAALAAEQIVGGVEQLIARA